MKISACYIAKNEAANLPRSINSLKAQVDEIVVVDTGSEDSTVTAAKSLGARVYHYSWQDDFAAARNFALAKTTGDWLILLDADEYFTSETAANLRQVLENAGDAEGLLIQMVNFDVDKQAVQDYFYQLRAVPRVSGLAYCGIVHEELRLHGEPLKKLKRVAPELLEIYHSGYRAELSKVKARRNLELLQQALAAGQSEKALARYLCECYAGLEDMEKALHYGWLDIRQGRQSINYATRCHRILMEYYGKQQDWASMVQRLELAALAVEQFPELPDFWAEYSESLYQWRRYQEAAAAADKAAGLLKDYQGLEPCMLARDNLTATLYARRQLFRRQAAKAAECRITACVIVRDEAANIGSWLMNAGVFADEILVVDTGSADNTKEIAVQAGAKVYDYVWQEDFAAARNFALEQTGEGWIVFTDADELFRYPDSLRGCLSDLKQSVPVSVPLCNIDKDNNGAVISTNTVIRIFPGQQGFGYLGAVHEQLADMRQPERILSCLQGDALLTLEHTGYSAGIIRAKLERNRSLIEQEIARCNNLERYYLDLANCCFGLGEYETALDYALRGTQSPYQPLGQQGDMYWLALESMEKLGYSLEDKMAVTEAALSAAGEIPDFWGYKGYFYWQAADYRQGADYLLKALGMAQRQEKEKQTVQASHFAQLANQFAAALADCSCHLGDAKQARTYYEQVLNDNKWYPEALTGYIDTFDSLADPQLQERLQTWYGGRPQEWQQLQKLLLLHGYVPGSDSEEQLLEDMALNLQYLFVALLNPQPDFASPMFTAQLGLLPEGLKNLVYSFHGENASGRSIACSDYQSMLQGVICWGSSGMLKRYLALAESFEAEEQKKLVQILAEREKYAEALQLLGNIQADSPAADSQFWFSCGKIFYALKEYASARACFAQVNGSEVNAPELASYEAWCREAGEE